jgi:ferredoxin
MKDDEKKLNHVLAHYYGKHIHYESEEQLKELLSGNPDVVSIDFHPEVFGFKIPDTVEIKFTDGSFLALSKQDENELLCIECGKCIDVRDAVIFEGHVFCSEKCKIAGMPFWDKWEKESVWYNFKRQQK